MKNKGFTLLELLIVIAIIALLLLVTAPQVLRHFANASNRAHEMNLRVLRDAATLYIIDGGADCIWAPAPGTKAAPIAEASVHDSWVDYVTHWPGPHQYVVEIKGSSITISPEVLADD